MRRLCASRFFSRDRLARCYKSADCFVFPRVKIYPKDKWWGFSLIWKVVARAGGWIYSHRKFNLTLGFVSIFIFPYPVLFPIPCFRNKQKGIKHIAHFKVLFSYKFLLQLLRKTAAIIWTLKPSHSWAAGVLPLDHHYLSFVSFVCWKCINCATIQVIINNPVSSLTTVPVADLHQTWSLGRLRSPSLLGMTTE